MNRPRLSVRIAGTPVVAACLAAAGVLLIGLWSEGQAPFLAALLGFGVIINALSSFRELKVYKAWREEWDSVGTFGEQRPKPRKSGLARLATLASMLLAGIPVFWSEVKDKQLQDGLIWLWLFCGGYLLVRLVMGVIRRVRERRAKAGRTKADTPPVSWMLSATVDAPSRETAVRSLPEYAARVLNR